jgi:hypothetical protein
MQWVQAEESWQWMRNRQVCVGLMSRMVRYHVGRESSLIGRVCRFFHTCEHSLDWCCWMILIFGVSCFTFVDVRTLWYFALYRWRYEYYCHVTEFLQTWKYVSDMFRNNFHVWWIIIGKVCFPNIGPFSCWCVGLLQSYLSATRNRAWHLACTSVRFVPHSVSGK